MTAIEWTDTTAGKAEEKRNTMEYYRKIGTNLIKAIDASNNYSIAEPGFDIDGYTDHRWESPEKWESISRKEAIAILGYEI